MESPAGFPIAAPVLPRPVTFDQYWEQLTFVHWPVRPEAVAHLYPPGTRPDVFAGRHRELLGAQRRGFSGRQSSQAAQPADESQAADRRSSSVSRCGPDHSVELPVHERCRRRGACLGCRRGIAAEALGGHAALRRRIRPRLGRDRRTAGGRSGQRLRADRCRGDRELRFRAFVRRRPVARSRSPARSG